MNLHWEKHEHYQTIYELYDEKRHLSDYWCSLSASGDVRIRTPERYVSVPSLEAALVVAMLTVEET